MFVYSTPLDDPIEIDSEDEETDRTCAELLPDHCDVGTATTQADVPQSLLTCPKGCRLWCEAIKKEMDALKRSETELETKVSALQKAVEDMAEVKKIEEQGRIISTCKFAVVGMGCVILLIAVKYCRYHLQTQLLKPKIPKKRDDTLINQCFKVLDSTFPNAEDDIAKGMSKVLNRIAEDGSIEQKFKQQSLDLLSKRRNHKTAVTGAKATI